MDFTHFFEYEVGIQKIRWSGDQGIGLCPIHEDSKRSFSFHRCTGQCHCFSCGWKGNAYTLAMDKGLPNPEKYLTNSEPFSVSPPTVNSIKSLEPLKNTKSPTEETTVERRETLDKQADKRRTKEIPDKIAELQARYVAQLKPEIIETLKTKHYMGMDENGCYTFHYPSAIKHHKSKDGKKAPYWEGEKDDKDKVIGSHAQIFMEDELADFDKSEPLYICEGEKDAIILPRNAISFSSGCLTVPDDISSLQDFEIIYIAYDNDKPGRLGAEAVAKRIKDKFPTIKVCIVQWESSLPIGYDVYDDAKLKFENFNKAINNSIEYKRGFAVMDTNTLLETYTVPPVHIVENLLVEKGVTLIAGSDGVGKTWFLMQMAFCIATGRDFLGWKVEKRPTLVIQFELSPEQLADRLRPFKKEFGDTDVKFALIGDNLIFDDAWTTIEKTVKENGIRDGVIFIDNIYSSTDKDVSNNHFIKPLLQRINMIKTDTGNAFVAAGHHNKSESKSDEEPLLNKHLITGGKILTNYVSNVFQIGDSSFGTHLRRGKITKIRDGVTDLYNIPVKLEWDEQRCLFSRKGIITNEKVHCINHAKRWEYKIIVSFSEYESHRYSRGKINTFNRERLWEFLTSEENWVRGDSENTKVTRLISRLVEWSFVDKLGHDNYKLNFVAIGELDVEK